MSIIDIHSHIVWDRQTGKYDVDGLLKDMDRNGIDIRVVSTLQGKSIRAANDFVSELATGNPDRIVGCAVLNPKDYETADEARHILELPGISMVEMNSVEHGYYPDSNEGVVEILQILEERRLPVKVFTGVGAFSLPHQWLVQAQRFPDIPFIFLHCGCFDYGYGCVDVAKNTPNVAVDSSNQYEVQILKKMFQELDASKIFFGSMFPERFTRCSIDLFEPFNLSAQALEQIMSGNARRLLGLELQENAT